MYIKFGEWFQQTTDRLDQRVEFGHAGRRLGVDESGAPAIGVDKFDEIVRGLCLHAAPEHAAAGLGSLPADVMESRARAFGFEHVGGGERIGVSDGAVLLLGNLRGGNGEAEQASVGGVEGFFDGRVIQKILVNKSAQLGTGVHERAANDGADFVNDRSGKASIKNGCAGGTCCAEGKNLHTAPFAMPFDATRGGVWYARETNRKSDSS